MEKAKTDRTYCVNKECNKKCFRHESHYEFDDNENYCWQMCCVEYLERKKEDEQ